MSQVLRARAINSRPEPSSHRFRLKLWATIVIAFLLVGAVRVENKPASALTPSIISGVKGYCLDLSHSKFNDGNPVDSWQCNNTAAQNWQVKGLSISNAALCLSVEASKSVTARSCQNSANQIWLRDGNGFINPDSQSCLSLPQGHTNQQLVVGNCSALNSSSQVWLYVGGQSQSEKCQGTEGQLVACYAAKEWENWRKPNSNHQQLLTLYTDNAAYEEWCADFISYVYKEAGFPFTNGGADGWDENDANSIQNMGFSVHNPSNYTPKAGDVAYFDYNGGHVEIVLSGGPKPTFIYGDSGTNDPQTGNGDMATNTITQDGQEGSLLYYLSPN